jgi:hypothetical protein
VISPRSIALLLVEAGLWTVVGDKAPRFSIAEPERAL